MKQLCAPQGVNIYLWPLGILHRNSRENGRRSFCVAVELVRQFVYFCNVNFFTQFVS